jgi:hypothetical protein
MIDLLFDSCVPGFAGMNGVEFTPIECIDGWPLVAGGVMATDFVFLGTNRWFMIYGTSQHFEEKMVMTDHGQKYEVSIKTFWPFDTVAARVMFGEMNFRKFAIKTTDNAGMVRVAGQRGNGLECRVVFKTGETLESERGWEVEWFGVMTEICPILN